MNAETLAWIEGRKPELVHAAEEYVQKNEIFKAAGHGRKARVSASQLRNLLNATQAESSLAVLINFLRYQVGRGRQGWQDTASGLALEALLKEKVGALGEAGEQKLEEADRHALEARLAALLLGYVIREYTFRCQQEGTSP